MNKSFPNKQLVTLLIIATLVVSSGISFPRPAHAIFGIGDITYDPINYVVNGITSAATAAAQTKGFTLDPLAWAVAQAALQAVVKSTINWVNHGFNGSPAYVTNLDTTMLSVSNGSADSFLKQLSTNGSINSPFQNMIASAVSNTYNTNTNGGYFAANPFTLGQVSSNPTAFLQGGSGFANGGLDAWLSSSMNPSNNPYGAAIQATNALNGQTANARSTQLTQLNWAKGIFSFKGSCSATGTATTGGAPAGAACTADAQCADTLACIASKCTGDGGPSPAATSLSTSDKCLAYNIQTPGTVIEAQLEKSLGSGIDSLVSAHTLDEIVNTVLGQLINQVVGNTGLAGVSQTSATTGNTQYFNQIDPTQAATNASLSTAFSTTLSAELSSVQTYQSQWTTILNAAQSAKTALSSSSCSPNTQTTITNTVQPIIDQATTAISKATSLINSINSIRASLAQSTSANATTQLSNASTANAIVTGSLPSPSDSVYANAESLTGTNPDGSPTLLSQMNQIAQQAQSCSVPVTH